MIGLAILFGADSILPKNAKTTGLIWFDAIDIIRLAAIKQVAGIGMIIMVAGGLQNIWKPSALLVRLYMHVSLR